MAVPIVSLRKEEVIQRMLWCAGMKMIQSPLTRMGVFFGTLLLVLTSFNILWADSPPTEDDLSFYEQFQEMAKTGIHAPLGFHYYWHEGLHMDSPKNRFRAKLSGRVIVDGGYIGADEAIQSAFPDFRGGDANFRDLRLTLTGIVYDHIDFEFDIDFANIRDIKDIWIGYKKAPFLGDIKVGHFREPISLERLNALADITFMERALPTEAFAPGRNMGIMCNNKILDDRMTWAAGAFLLTGSFENIGDFNDQLSEAFGTALTARVTGLPRYADNGRQLLHLGLSYSRQFRNEQRAESDLKLRTHPESRLTDQVLVNTGRFPTNSMDLLGGELATVSGPLSFQGEFFHALTDASTVGNPRFWGFYGYASYFLTGEHRSYNRSLGLFSGIAPEQDFHLLDEGWGAWELAFRFSYVDLNDKAVKGGKEANFTFGVNWYLSEKSRFMFNFIHAKVTDRADPPIDDGRANIFQIRFQYSI
jgi:phosphate-selective porin OprO and OprP